MNQKKILIMSLLVLLVAGLSLSAVSASDVKTIKIVKKDSDVLKELKNGDTLRVVYTTHNGEFDRGVSVLAACYKGGELNAAKKTKITKTKVYFKKNKKIKVTTKKVKKNFVKINLIKGYTPYKVKIWYKNK
jgi:hypothetical protein